MKNYLSIVKLLLKNIFKYNNKGKSNLHVGIIVLLAISYLFIALFLVLGAIMFAYVFQPLGLTNELIVLMFFSASVVVLIFGIVSMLNQLYFSRDTEFFLTLPIKPATIFAAKMTVVYITELMVTLLFLLPVLITIGIALSMSILYYIVMLIGILLAPSIPLLIATFLAIPVMYLVSFFKNKGALTSVFLISIMGLFFGFYFYFVIAASSNVADDIESKLKDMQGFLVGLSNILYPFLALARLSTLTSAFGLNIFLSSLVNFGIFIGTVALLVSISMLISNFVYTKGAASQLESASKKSSGKEKFVSDSVVKSLAKREWREIIRTPYFAYQCLACIVLAPVIVFVMTIMNYGDFSSEEVQFSAEVISKCMWMGCLAFVLMMGVGMNFAASSAITREGKNFYIMKTLPIEYKTQIKAKLIVYTLISFVASILCVIVLFSFYQNVIYAILSLIYLFIYSYGFNCFAVYVDLKKPKLDWTTPNEAMKQNFNIAVPMLVNMAISFILIGIPIAFILLIQSIIGDIIMWAILLAFSIIIGIVFHNVLYNNLDSNFEKLS